MAEKEYIERGAVLNAISALAIRITPIEENRDRFYHDSGWNGACVGARVEVGKTPAADVVEVVRCKDCKDFALHGNGKAGTCRNQKCKGIRYATDFCSYGERKEL